MKIVLFASLIVLGLVTIAHAQSVDFYGNPIGKDVCAQYGMKDDKEAIECMDKICGAAGIPNNFVLLPCPSVDNCFALYKDGIAFIVYDIAFFNKVKTFGFTERSLPKDKVDWTALTILAHELGHHLCQHTTNKLVREKYTPVQMELQADEFAGTILYRLGASLAQAQQAMKSSDVPDEATLSHPARKDRLDAIAKGYNGEMKKYADRNPTGANTAKPEKDTAAIKSELKQADDYCKANNYAAAFEAYKNMDAADLDGYAMTNLGFMYLNGYGVNKDYAQAKTWCEKAAASGSILAMNDLGYIYENGWGVPQDYAQAKTWYEKSAAGGYLLAMNNIGALYAFGHGVQQDYSHAKTWFEKAANGGDDRAMFNIGFFYLNGYGVARDYLQAKNWFEKAANAGNAGAMTSIGDLYANGYGVEADNTQAKVWYDKACGAGNAAGCDRAKNIAKKL